MYDLMTNNQIYVTEPLSASSDASGVEADEFLSKQAEETAKLWAVYNYSLVE